MKKIIALLLVCILALGLFAGCTPAGPGANHTDGDPVTLHYWIAGYPGQPDAEKVFAEANKLIQKKYPHITVEFHVSTDSDYPTHVSLAQSERAPMDIIGTFGLNYQTEMSNGAYLDITEYLSEFPDLMKALPEFAYGWGKMDGKTYGFPNWQQCNYNNQAIMIDQDHADKYNFDNAALTAAIAKTEFLNPEVYDILESYMKAAKDAGDDSIVVYPLYDLNELGIVSRGYEEIINGFYYAWDDETCQLVNIFKSKEFKEYCAKLQEWYAEGYMKADYVGGNYGMGDSAAKKLGYHPIALAGQSFVPNFYQLRSDPKQYGYENLEFFGVNKSTEEFYIGYSYAAGLTCVGVNCVSPKDALRVIEMLYTDAELQNLLVYGIEGEHYDKNEDGTIYTYHYSSGQANASSPYGLRKFTVGNSALTWINQSFDQEMYDWAFKDLATKGIPSKLIGWAPDTGKVQGQLNSINSVLKEYSRLAQNKLDNWEEVYDEFIGKLEAAGYDKVMEHLQGQIDEFLASK